MKNLLYIVFFLIITGCSYSRDFSVNNLDRAEQMLHTDPTAALSLLNALDISEFHDSSTIARWALLYSEAMVANNYCAPTDTIVDIAIDYYAAHRHRDKYHHACGLKALLAESAPDTLASALYLQKEKEYMLCREKSKRERLIYISALLFLVLLGVIACQHQRIRIGRLRSDALIADADAMRKDVASMLSTLHRSRFNVIDELCETYYQSQGAPNERKVIAEKVKSQITDLKKCDGIYVDMVDSVNRCHDNLLEKLRGQWPAIKPEEYRLAVYLAANLSSRTIALLLDESINVVYKRKSRLKSKIEALSLPDSELFLSIF